VSQLRVEGGGAGNQWRKQKSGRNHTGRWRQDSLRDEQTHPAPLRAPEQSAGSLKQTHPAPLRAPEQSAGSLKQTHPAPLRAPEQSAGSLNLTHPAPLRAPEQSAGSLKLTHPAPLRAPEQSAGSLKQTHPAPLRAPEQSAGSLKQTHPAPLRAPEQSASLRERARRACGVPCRARRQARACRQGRRRRRRRRPKSAVHCDGQKSGACRAPTGCVHAGAGPECGGVAHSGPRCNCGPRIIGGPILGPHFRPVRAQTGRVQGAHRVRARRCRAGMWGCGPQWPPPQMRAGDYWRANSGPPFLAGARPNRARAGRPQGARTQVPGRNGGVWPTVAPAAIAGRGLLAGRFWAPIFGPCARKPGACRAPTGCVHAGAGPECGGVAHSGPRRKCGPAIIGAPILGPHFWPVRAQTGRVQGAHRVRARRCSRMVCFH